MDATSLWKHYRNRAQFWARVVRVLPFWVLYIGLGFGIMNMMGFPYVPVRGDMSLLLDRFLIAINVVLFSLLLFIHPRRD